MVNVKLKLFPGERSPELNAPWSAVTVWVTESLFVQVTFVPVFTMRLAGLKAKFIILTLFPLLVVPFVGVLVGAVVGVLVGVVVVAPPQAARSTSRPAATRHNHAFVVVVV